MYTVQKPEGGQMLSHHQVYNFYPHHTNQINDFISPTIILIYSNQKTCCSVLWHGAICWSSIFIGTTYKCIYRLTWLHMTWSVSPFFKIVSPKWFSNWREDIQRTISCDQIFHHLHSTCWYQLKVWIGFGLNKQDKTC